MKKDPTEKNRILIVDDHPLFRQGLQQMIDDRPELIVCGQAADAAEALRVIPELKPDLVLVDISLGGTSGIDLVKSIRDQHEDLPVLVISMHDESLYAERALRAGAMGYVMKHEPAATVEAAISTVLGGHIYVSPRMSTSMLAKFTRGKSDEPSSALQKLTDRELEVFRMLGQGKGTRQIAEELNLTIATINTFRAHIKEKLQLKSSTEVMLHAIQE
ncbi:MAG: two component transcriptional regulator, LuxR family, partial [Pedosphaera sp.]|nr:two component transcriptional regulator, LuxR family [Pedosphaera sp.]